MAQADSGLDIYVMNADGSGVTRVTRNQGTDYDPAWSPKGDQIAFAIFPRERPGAIYVMRPDGSGQTRLTTSLASDSKPAWSPDGNRITFQRMLFANLERRDLRHERRRARG